MKYLLEDLLSGVEIEHIPQDFLTHLKSKKLILLLKK